MVMCEKFESGSLNIELDLISSHLVLSNFNCKFCLNIFMLKLQFYMLDLLLHDNFMFKLRDLLKIVKILTSY
ncbi:hypothetical protein BpHYR1_042442 [Brachionus plicatilis]|uniref:Uncharacterized protein n=1 Tax=Brachionus plicatilis TaxID=10195 RepID=A0A3M7QX29_BRAPC|nr:hypothetical protein BpHYR1_042442 [Brachionus plicatilis]